MRMENDPSSAAPDKGLDVAGNHIDRKFNFDVSFNPRKTMDFAKPVQKIDFGKIMK